MRLHVENLCKSFPTRSGTLEVLRGINLDLAPGGALAVLGPSGSGKSTLLHLLGTLDRPTSGDYRLGDQEPFALSDTALARFRNQHIGFVFQEHYLLPQCSVLENVLIPTLAGGVDRKGAEARARELLGRVGLAERLEHRPAELSGGERQRVAVARAVLLKPTLLLADEPTGNLDPDLSLEIMNLFREINARGTTVVVATHDRELIRRVGRRAVTLDHGRIVEVG